MKQRQQFCWRCFAIYLIGRTLGSDAIIAPIGIKFFILLSLGLTIGLGFAGLVDLETAGSSALGAYTAALITTSSGSITSNNFAVVLLSATLAGFGLALLTRRMCGDYLAVVTLAAAQLFQQQVVSASTWMGGYNQLRHRCNPRATWR